MEQLAILNNGPSVRQALLPSVSEGPYAIEQSTPIPTASGAIGQQTVALEIGKAAPIMVESPAPFTQARGRVPTIYTNPNHYEFPPNLGGRQVASPTASIPVGDMLAYDHRHDWRRPSYITPAPIDPATGKA